MEWLSDPQAWIALLTLTVLEVVLGIDNVIFISILAGKLPAEQQKKARTIGLAMAMIMRVLLLLSLAWIVRLTAPLFTVLGQEISGRDLILLARRHCSCSPRPRTRFTTSWKGRKATTSNAWRRRSTSVIVQIMLLDIVFSLDSVITAVGMAKDLGVMITAVIIAVLIMLVSAGSISDFVNRHPDREDAGAELPAADRHVADRRRARLPHPEGLRLLRDGLLGVRRDAEHPVPPQGQAGQAARRLHLVRTALAAMAVVALAAGCRTAPVASPAGDAFWRALQPLCGKAFAGRLVEGTEPSDASMRDKELVMHVRHCSASEIRIPFHVGEDRSRTWVLRRTADGFTLKHDHRHEDGSEDRITQYGGGTRIVTAGSTALDFHADAHTAALIPAAATNVWTLAVDEGARTFSYALRREATARRFRVEFDLTREVPPPPPPWGAEPQR